MFVLVCTASLPLRLHISIVAAQPAAPAVCAFMAAPLPVEASVHCQMSPLAPHQSGWLVPHALHLLCGRPKKRHYANAIRLRVGQHSVKANPTFSLIDGTEGRLD